MCYYITATIPSNTKFPEIISLLKECKFGYDPIQNASLQDAIGKNRLYFKPTLTDCDCGTPLGGMNTRKSYEPEALEKQAAIQRKKGWGEAKIRRWLAEKQGVQNRIEADKLAKQAEWVLSDSEWQVNIKKLISSGIIKEFGLLLHWYTGPMSGKIELKEVRTQKIKATDPMYFHTYPENVLTYFT